jgi:hypothetical protein
MDTNDVEKRWEALRRNRGAAPAKIGNYFHPQAQVLYVPTATLYRTIPNDIDSTEYQVDRTQSIEQLMASWRDSYQYITESRVVSRHVDHDKEAVVEVLSITLSHNIYMDWLLDWKPTRKQCTVELVFVSQLRDGLIWRQRVYWDQRGVLASLKRLRHDYRNANHGLAGLVTVSADSLE